MAVSSKSDKVVYECGSCGYESLRWAGKCPGCGGWNTFKESIVPMSTGASGASGSATPVRVSPIGAISKKSSGQRLSLGFREFDRVLGGGLVPGEVVLVAGEPGIGKSTLLLQTALELAKPVLYVSGEESLSQLSSRLERLRSGRGSGSGKGEGKKSYTKKAEDSVLVTDETDVDSVVATIEKEKPDLVIVDSIQALSTSDSTSYAGSIAQVRECGARLTECAKKADVPILLVGQVTKEGAIAGPKVIEHVVDAVVYFEGDEMGMYRVLRCVKNRFGTTEEVGIFEMTAAGLIEVDDASNLLEDRGSKISGSAVSAIYKGSRTLFVEIQALTSPAMFGSPRRMPNGLSKQRLEMLCAVLTRRAGVNVSEDDVFVNVLGGMRLDDPSVDLAICAAIASAKLDVPVDRSSVFVGEVGLSGDVREVPFLPRIRKEITRRKMSIIARTGKRPLSLHDILKPILKKTS